ncbi:hypothetical protein [Luteococcus sp.]|uniref:hypothetical protein n=1 Tax=Luteococcus sp. TaxID=1969402 RepID=UPI0037361551
MGKLVAVLALVPIAVSSVLGLMGKDGSVEGTQPPAQVQVDGGAGDVTLQVSTGVGRYELPDRWSAMPGDAVDRFQNELTPGAWLTVQRTPSTSEPLESQCLSQAPVMDGRQPVPLPAPPGIAGAPAVALEGTGEAGGSLTWCLEHDRDVVVLVGGSASADRVVVEEAMTRVADSFQ